MKHFSKKPLAILLAFVLVFGMTGTAFAAWQSFQNARYNNGVIDPVNNGVPPITQPQTMTSVGLATNNPFGTVYSGIDNATVLNTVSGVTTAYTLQAREQEMTDIFGAFNSQRLQAALL